MKSEAHRTFASLFADTASNSYLSMTGCAEMLRDVAKAKELWSTETQTWWPKGPTDPDVRVLRSLPTARNIGMREAIQSPWR